ncbi:MAG: peptide deformylase [Acidobacteria bacterium]|nr:peptide deformylase [Acidobacteriota bacterium]
MRLKILQAGDEMLRAKARELSPAEILAEETERLIEHMKNTMRDAPGVGLAAPQVGVPVQLVVVEDREEYHKKLTPAQLAERERRPVPFHVLINPRIVARDQSTAEFFEGCLSLVGYVAIVPRSASITVEFSNERAEPVRLEARGWYARILQHEMDHLSGVLYTDRMHSRTLSTIENMERFWKDFKAHEVRTRLA